MDSLEWDFQQYPYVEVCNPEDHEMLRDISDAVSYIAHHDFAFETFDLRLSENDKLVLDKFMIEEDVGLSNCKDLANISQLVNQFIKIVGKGANNAIINEYVSNLSTHIINNIIDASGYDKAYVFLKTFVDLERYYKGRIPSYYGNDSLLHWHIDKPIEEILFGNNNNNITIHPDVIHLFTLKGKSTLYKVSNQTVYQEFMDDAYNGLMTYEHFCNVPQCDLHLFPELFPHLIQAEVISPQFGYGAVHFASKERGAIHAIPQPYHDRFMAIVIPQDEENLQKYCNFKKVAFGG